MELVDTGNMAGNSFIEKIDPKERPEEAKFSIQNMDTNEDPMANFFRFANGKWIDTHPIPPDKSSWGGFMELRDRNIYILGKILEKCALDDGKKRGIEKMVGDFYISIMDQKKLEEKKFDPIKPIMEKINKVRDKNEMVKVSQYLHSNGIGNFFSVFSMPDEKNSSVYAFYIYQGGLSLPNRDYYIQDSFQKTRDEFVAHMQNMFTMYGYSPMESKDSAEKVMKIETYIAKASRPQADLRDSEKNYNRIPYGELNEKFSRLNLVKYLEISQVPKTEYIVVGQPEVLDAVEKMLEEFSLEDLKTYLRWNTINYAAPYLHEAAEMEHFDFFNRKLLGQEVPEKRWKKAVNIVDRSIGEALGELYVEQEFGKEARERMQTMVDDIRSVFEEKLKNLPWMSDVTKKKALEKFSKFRAKIGYPSKFIDYSSIDIRKDDLLGNVMRSENFEFRREASRIGEQVDKELWLMTPPTVNAYFSPTENEIVFPAGILQPPFFDATMDDAVNYGGIGGVISHEITHGFDDQGRRYDMDGNLKDWWTEEDAKKFTERADEVVKLYDSLEVLPGLHVNGKLTLGENIADLGGVSIAFEALQRRLRKNPELNKKIDGFTPEQRFFLSWAQIWRGNNREPEIRRRISIDPHSPNVFRGSIPVMNHEKFDSSFVELSKVKKGLDKKIFIW
ncbi:M13 family metallopeptidase [Cuniculiplasma divulgatum]|uniref:Metalloendopeptidase n=1 Tax=Cuniculiplasma divulgatum TaxID=1673428 RepID=A0A1R4A4W8_9ARCH|nr:M13 family metallopeptidase [Cuniculiplasma divulgatum]SJK84013.1 metalloendopeptidase [Cuniculiplasma divulgatum]